MTAEKSQLLLMIEREKKIAERKNRSMLEALLISALLITAATAIEPPLRQLAPDLLEIHFIGDIHGDAECAQQWLRRTGAVNLDATPPQWIKSKSAVVFMGDYVDKGVASPATLNFVKMLTERFPDNVVAMLGNHDLFALIDASTVLARADNFTSMPHASPMETTHPMGGPVSRYVYAFQHPEEFLRSGYSPHREDDEELLSALMTAILHIYAANSESRVSMATEAFDQSGRWLPLWTATLFKDGGDLEERVKTRLRRWIQEYSEGLQRDGLLKWLGERPLVAVVGDALVVHAGVPARLLRTMSRVLPAEKTLGMLAKGWPQLFDKSSWPDVSAKLRDRVGEFVQHRGYFKASTGCKDVNAVLGMLNKNAAGSSSESTLKRIVVGHTPDDYAHERCGGALVAADSSLGRRFRAFGNRYCPGHKVQFQTHDDNVKGKREQPEAVKAMLAVAGCGRDRLRDACEGTITRLVRKTTSEAWPASVEVIPMPFQDGRVTTLDVSAANLKKSSSEFTWMGWAFRFELCVVAIACALPLVAIMLQTQAADDCCTPGGSVCCFGDGKQL